VDGFPPKSELVTAFVEHGVGETEPECESGKPGYQNSVEGGFELGRFILNEWFLGPA